MLSLLLSTTDIGETLCVAERERFGGGRKGSPARWKEFSLGMFWDCDNDWTVTSAPEMVSAILGHASTLTALKLDSDGHIGCKDLQHFLCFALNLREFHLLRESRTLRGPDHCLDATDVMQSEWVCLDLKEFGCEIRGIPRPDITVKLMTNQQVNIPLRDHTVTALNLSDAFTFNWPGSPN